MLSENNKKVSLVLWGLVRIKVVSWPGFPRKAELEQRLPSGGLESDFREQSKCK